MRIINIVLLSWALIIFEQSIFAQRLDNEQYRQKYNIQVTGNNAKEVMPCVPSRVPGIEDIPEKLATILTRLTAIKASVASHDKSTQTEFDALCALLNEIIKGEGCLEKKIKECCSDLASAIDELSDSSDKNFATLIDTLNVIATKDDALESNLESCCSTINARLNELESLIESEFVTVGDQLKDIRAQESVIHDALTSCCNTLDTKLDNLTQIVVEDFGSVFETLKDIQDQETVIQDFLVNCCTTLNSKLDNFSDTVQTDFTLVFQALDDAGELQSTIESKLDNCCMNVESKLDSILLGDSAIESKVDALNNLVTADFAGSFTVLSAQSQCSSIAITAATLITTSGHYCLANDLSGSGPLIGIIGNLANDVILDLNGHSLSSDDYGIALDGGASHKNIEIFNGSIIGGVFGVAINSSVIPHQNIQLRNVSIRDASAVGFFAETIQGLIIDQVSTFNCGNNLINACSNVSINSSFFNNNVIDGCNIMNSNNIAIISSFFNDNGSFASGIAHHGLLMESVNSFKAINCRFGNSNTVNTNQQFGVAVTAAIANSNNLEFDSCSFNNNAVDGVVTVTASSGSPSNIVTNINFVQCCANSNGKSGFHFTNTVLNSSINNCQANRNILYGYLIDGLTPAAVDIQNSLATGNGIVGFEIASGSGLLESNRALSNASCGFDMSFTATAQYTCVGNIAKNNGSSPANKNLSGTDSNYCIAGAASAFVTPGPGKLPYSQMALVPGASNGSWDNITAQ